MGRPIVIKNPRTFTIILEEEQFEELAKICYEKSKEEHRRVGMSELARTAIQKYYPVTKICQLHSDSILLLDENDDGA